MIRLVVVGGGPVGLHAALSGRLCGYDVRVLEKGQLADGVSGWSDVRLFTPFHMNSTAAGRKVASGQGSLPDVDDLLTGGEYVRHYLVPLSQSAELRDCIRTETEVVAVSRLNQGKAKNVGSPQRAATPFRLLIRSSTGEETLEADVVLDCTGFTARHRFVGQGGIPCPGELDVLSDQDYQIAIARDESPTEATVLVVGSGYSAATSVVTLAEVVKHVIWVTRDRPQPLTAIPDDTLPERRRMTETANRLAADPDSVVEWKPGFSIDEFRRDGGRIAVTVTDSQNSQSTITVDRVVANPGFRPDGRPFEELQIHRCYATDGPIKLAAHLLGETATDCLAQSVPCADLLSNPEPNFYILGAASYGRDSRFLLRNGLEQIDQLFESMSAAAETTA